MKSNNGYRFNLSFKGDTPERIFVGDFLNKLKSKKSRFIVDLVFTYLKDHPELLQESESHKILIQSSIDNAALKSIREDMRLYLDNAVAEAISHVSKQISLETIPSELSEELSEDLSEMLDDLSIFQ